MGSCGEHRKARGGAGAEWILISEELCCREKSFIGQDQSRISKIAVHYKPPPGNEALTRRWLSESAPAMPAFTQDRSWAEWEVKLLLTSHKVQTAFSSGASPDSGGQGKEDFAGEVVWTFFNERRWWAPWEDLSCQEAFTRARRG